MSTAHARIEDTSALPTAAESPPAATHSLLMPAVGTMSVVLIIACLHAGRPLVLPVVVALLLSIVLSPVVRALRRRGIPERVGSAFIVFGVVAIVVVCFLAAIGPATDWVSTLPQNVSRVEARIRGVTRPLEAIQKTAEKVQQVGAPPSTGEPPRVAIVSEGVVARWTSSTLSVLFAIVSIVFLTYFLLASGPMFRRKLADVLPRRVDRTRVINWLEQIELVASRFLLLSLMINTGVAAATAAGLRIVGMPHPVLWGATAGLLNFVPYIGALATTTVLSLAALSISDPGTHVIFAPVIFVFIHLIESNLVTPTVLGHRLPVSPIVIFVGLLFWGWVWGIPGAVIAVPLTVVIKITCDHLPALQHIGDALGN
jgi:predicted PurR-regulated permease PerM